MTASSDWFDNPEALLEVLRGSSRRARPPRIPGYTDLDELGHGGQGIVYSAIQRSTGQRVAVKVLAAPHFTSQTGRRRFEREIEVVTTLRHPNIVRVYDSGTTSDGRPYSVMEYIEGLPLDEWIADSEVRKSQGFTVRNPKSAVGKALLLFVKVCDAIHYAHQRGVVHRDLKPSNIRIDSSGEPHILDFGLAKDTSGSADSMAVSVTGQFMGSLPWASPEQANGFPDGIDVRTDVYSLGVVLFQMLTGRFPYEVTGAVHDVLNNILKSEPARPRKINQAIDDELETIVLKCLVKEPERRYQGAGELAADIRHYLAGEPIEAKRDSASYVLRKNLRRYRWFLATAAVFVLVLLTSSIVAWILMVEAGVQRTKAEEYAEDLARSVYETQIDRAYQDYQRVAMASMRSRLADVGLCPEQLRGWEWEYLYRLAEGSEKTLRGHGESIWQIVFSPDGSQIASASLDDTVRLWDIAREQELWSFSDNQGDVFGVAFWPDGERIVSVSRDQAIRIWDVETRKLLLALRTDEAQPNAVAVNPSGDVIAVGNGSGSLDVWALTGGTWARLHGSLRRHRSAVFSLDFTNDGEWLLTGSEDSVRLWNVRRGLEVRPCLAASDREDQAITTQSARFRHGDRQFAALGLGHKVNIHDLATGEILRSLSGHTGGLQAVAWSPDGRWLASAGMDTTIRVWNAVGTSPPWVLRGHEQTVNSVVFSPDGCWIASAGEDATIRVWRNPATDWGHDELDGPAFSIAGLPPRQGRAPRFTPDGALYYQTGNQVDKCDAQTGEITTLPFLDHSVAFDLSSDGLRLARVRTWADQRTDEGRSQIVVTSSDSEGRELGRTDLVPAECNCVAFSPDGGFLAAGSRGDGLLADGLFGVDIWDVKQPERFTIVRRLRGHKELVNAVAYTSSGEQIVTASQDKTLRLWDARMEREPLLLKDHDGPVTCACFSPDGSLIASGSQNASCLLWEARTGHPLKTLVGHQATVASVAFHPSGQRLASSDTAGKTIIWDVETGRALLELDSGAAGAASVFSPDGRILAAFAGTGLRLWETGPRSSPEIIRRRLLLGTAHQIVDPILALPLILPNEAMDRLEADLYYQEAPPVERAAMKQLIRLYGQAYAQLENTAWQYVEFPMNEENTPEERQRVKEEQKRACRLLSYVCAHESPVEFRHSLGVAEYRTGKLNEALATLSQTTAERGYPHDHSFLAMTLHQLGRVEDAREQLRKAKQSLKAGCFNQPYMHRFVEEAEELLGPPGSQPSS